MMERMSRRPLLAVIPTAFAGLVVLFLLALGRTDPDHLPSAFIGKPAPPLTVVEFGTAGYAMTTPAELAAPEFKLVNFWASWCAPCRAEHPNLETLASLGIPIHGINYKDRPDNAKRFLTRLGNPFVTVAADPRGRTALDWGLYGVPETFIIDASGRVAYRHAGPITRRDLEKTFLPMLDGSRAGVPGQAGDAGETDGQS